MQISKLRHKLLQESIELHLETHTKKPLCEFRKNISKN